MAPVGLQQGRCTRPMWKRRKIRGGNKKQSVGGVWIPTAPTKGQFSTNMVRSKFLSGQGPPERPTKKKRREGKGGSLWLLIKGNDQSLNPGFFPLEPTREWKTNKKIDLQKDKKSCGEGPRKIFGNTSPCMVVPFPGRDQDNRKGRNSGDQKTSNRVPPCHLRVSVRGEKTEGAHTPSDSFNHRGAHREEGNSHDLPHPFRLGVCLPLYSCVGWEPCVNGKNRPEKQPTQQGKGKEKR